VGVTTEKESFVFWQIFILKKRLLVTNEIEERGGNLIYILELELH
jgi:hypothetical protein